MIDKACYGRKPHEIDDVGNNRLALTAEVHHWFDGRNVYVPLFKFAISTDHPIPRKADFQTKRFQVNLLVTAIDEDVARMLFPRLREGSTKLNGLQAIVSLRIES